MAIEGFLSRNQVFACPYLASTYHTTSQLAFNKHRNSRQMPGWFQGHIFWIGYLRMLSRNQMFVGPFLASTHHTASQFASS